jgi:hypothetical protein
VSPVPPATEGPYTAYPPSRPPGASLTLTLSSTIMNYIQVSPFPPSLYHANSGHFFSLRNSARPHSLRYLSLADFFILHRRGDVRHSVQSMLIPTSSFMTSHLHALPRAVPEQQMKLWRLKRYTLMRKRGPHLLRFVRSPS